MNPSMIVDCSITMAWCFADEFHPVAEQIQNRLVSESAIVPGIWTLEVANVLAIAQRRGRITEAAAQEFLVHLRKFDIEVESILNDSVFDAVLPLARRTGLTIYDASYLELAIRRQLPIATFDAALIVAARSNGITVLE